MVKYEKFTVKSVVVRKRCMESHFQNRNLPLKNSLTVKGKFNKSGMCEAVFFSKKI